MNLPAWAVEFDRRLKAVETDARNAATYALDAWKVGEDARAEVKRSADRVEEAVARLERCFLGEHEASAGHEVQNHKQFAEGIAKLSRGMDRIRRELRSKGHRGPNVEDSSVWAIPPPGFVMRAAAAPAHEEKDDPNAIVRGRGSWRIRLPSGKWRIALLVVSHVAVGGTVWTVIQAVAKLFH